jgi:hypothetical protein
MNEKEQLAWCAKHHATVWFVRDGVKVKTQFTNSAIKGQTLEQAIQTIEQLKTGREKFFRSQS